MSPVSSETAHVAPNSFEYGTAAAGTRRVFFGTTPSGVTIPMCSRTTFLTLWAALSQRLVTRWR